MSDFKAKMHQNPKFGWGSAPNPAGRAYSAPDPLAGFKWPTSKGREGSGWEGWDVRGEECCGVQKILKIDPDNTWGGACV